MCHIKVPLIQHNTSYFPKDQRRRRKKRLLIITKMHFSTSEVPEVIFWVKLVERLPVMYYIILQWFPTFFSLRDSYYSKLMTPDELTYLMDISYYIKCITVTVQIN